MPTVKSTSQAESRNQVLASLASAEFGLPEAHLALVKLRVPQQLESPNGCLIQAVSSPP